MITISECNFDDKSNRQAVINLMNHYMADAMGGKMKPYTPEMEEQVLEGLHQHPSKLVLLAKDNDTFIGLTNCFVNFGTFAAKPFINIHDVVVLESYRGKGVGQKLMEAIAKKAKELDCAKITLEVRHDNVYAQKLYKKMGYTDSKPPMYFWTKYL